MIKLTRQSTLVLALSLLNDAAFAKAAKGPEINAEQAGAAAVVGGDQGVAPNDLHVVRRRYELNLLAPIPAQVLGGMLVFKGDVYKERRDYTGLDASGGQSADERNPNVAGWGFAFLPHASEGNPKFFLVIERYGYLSAERKSKPMGEYIIGANIADDDMPFHLKFSPTDEAVSQVLVRLRRFPGFDRWLFLVGHRIESKSGLSIDAAYPSHLLLGWKTRDGAWQIFGGGRAVGREYPMEYSGGQRGWIEGFTGYGLAGLRRRAYGPLFVTLESGVQKEWTDWHEESGRIFQQYVTAAAPYVRAGVETWVETP